MIKYSLRSIVGNQFPKKCSCGNEFGSREIYMESTLLLSGSLYKEVKGAVMEVRNCKNCHAQLMIEVQDLRDYTLDGVRKRQKHMAERTF